VKIPHYSAKRMWGHTAVAGLVLATAWLLPLTVTGAVLGWIATVLFCQIAHRTFYCYAAGCLAYSLAFSWLTFTIHFFGGFTAIPTVFIFLAFVFGSTIQFIIFSSAVRLAPTLLKATGLHFPLAWLAGEALWIRIFPWSFGHSLLPVTPFALGATLGGVPLITFLMLWSSGALVVRHRRSFIAAVISIAAVTVFGYFYHNTLTKIIEQSEHIKVSAVQANVSIEERSDQRFFANNRQRYVALSEDLGSSDLVVWPEGVIQDWIPVEVTNVSRDRRLPHIAPPPAWIVGTMMYDSDRHFYNSALVIEPSGNILPPYHKQVLMPFGEYIPFTRYIGWIGGIADRIGGLTPGTDIQVLRTELPLRDGIEKTTANLTPLICYEDIIPSLSSQAAQRGTQLLVNLTNDAWFGRSAAAAQHHQIAAFRAIENGRVLVRSTNTGLTSIINPDGSMLGSLPQFSEEVLTAEVPLLSFMSPINRLELMDWSWWVGCFYAGGLLVYWWMWARGMSRKKTP
jgi:apolipoprotein N-acyltransferase